MVSGDQKILNMDAIQKLQHGTNNYNVHTNYIFRRLNGQNKGSEGTRNAPIVTQNNFRYTSHKKVYLDEQGHSPRNIQDLTVITDVSKKSHEVVKDLKFPNASYT